MTTHSALLEILKLQLGTKFLLKDVLHCFANASSTGGNDEVKDPIKHMTWRKCYIAVKLEISEADFLGS